ncbi:MAG TPA: FABP family protein [Actinocrinis sp.]|nr:FABP family protein [Actinocrinis sp.]
MPFEIPADLAAPALPLAFLLGRWAGVGLGQYPTVEDFRFGQEVEFSYLPGKPFLEYVSRSWLIDDDGVKIRPLATETGYWRPGPALPDGRQGIELEVLLTHPTGITEIWLGELSAGKIELHTDAVARTSTAKEYSAGHRLYGLVKGDLYWTFDMAAMGQPMTNHLAAQLKRDVE